MEKMIACVICKEWAFGQMPWKVVKLKMWIKEITFCNRHIFLWKVKFDKMGILLVVKT